MITRLWNQILDLFFPAYCVNCGKIGSFLCANCARKIIIVKTRTCPACNKITEKGKYCSRCRAKHQLSGIIVFGYFRDEPLKKLVHAYKYQKLSAMSGVLSAMLSGAIEDAGIKFDFISWVPATRKRLSWRGFNQSELLAKEIAKKFEKPLIRLAKIKETETQVGLTKKERLENLSGAIRVKSTDNFNGKTALLIDDVVTTGTTLNECAKVLKQNGARSVWGAVLAKE